MNIFAERSRYSLVLLIFMLYGLPTQAVVLPDSIRSNFIYTDLYTYTPDQVDQLIGQLQAAGFNTVAVPIAWGLVEPRDDEFDFSLYTRVLDQVTAAGLKLILVLDSSGRELIHFEQGSLQRLALPDWLLSRAEQAESYDFMGVRGLNLDYNDTRHLPYLTDFYQHALALIRERYADAIHSVVPGITHELEIKYSQYGYRWQSYTEAAQQAFAHWLQQQNKPVTKLPVIDYPNNIGEGLPRYEPLFEDLMRFRETRLKAYVCRLTDWIRTAGFKAGAYFGQSLHSHDAIYALGIIEETVDCFDTVTVDFNYYDGFTLYPEPWVLPLLYNYAQHLGYEEVAAGLYVERFYEAEAMDTAWSILADTLRVLGQQGYHNVEIGNIEPADLSQIKPSFWAPLYDSGTSEPAHYQIGIVASKWTFYLWTGEHSYQRNISLDALIGSYRLLSQQADFAVAILGEQALQQADLSRFDALILPHQTTLSAAAAQAIEHYYQRGGKLVQDVQYQSFALDGKPRYGWENDLFGISAIEWRHADDKFIVAGRRLVLPRQNQNYFSHFLLAPKQGYELRMRRFNNLDVGLMLRNQQTLTFGFLPQLIEDPGKGDFWQQLYVDAIRDLLNGV